MSEFRSQNNPNILVTGGAGYIGSHTVLCLLEAGYDVTVVDNLVNSNFESIKRVVDIVGCDSSRVTFYETDLCDLAQLENVFSRSPQFQACIHFAGLKAVGESVANPLLYYENNLGSTLNLLKLMEKYGCKSIIFSSSATVYGDAVSPISEDTTVGLGITNSYGRTKFIIEEILKDYKRSRDLAKEEFSIVLLRYFNPVGNHPSGKIGEDPNGIPNNLTPFVAQVAVGRRPKVSIFGNDYPTPDGTGVRDYIHVMDLSEGHVAALRYASLNEQGFNKLSIFNLGTGVGSSVLDIIHAMEIASGKKIPYEFAPRREGDIATCYASCEKAADCLKWRSTRTVEDMFRDLWAWQSSNPNGYATSSKE